jgi:hypothetical protein
MSRSSGRVMRKITLQSLADQITAERERLSQVWCIFDTTAAGAAWENAETLNAGGNAEAARKTAATTSLLTALDMVIGARASRRRWAATRGTYIPKALQICQPFPTSLRAK